MPSLINGIQFLFTKSFTALGDGQRLVNCPMRPLSARFRAGLHVSYSKRATEGMLSFFLTNFFCNAVGGRLQLDANKFLKALTSGGRGRGSDPPPKAMATEWSS